MSIETKTVQHEADCLTGSDAVELLIRSREKDLGGFSVRRLLPTAKRKMVGPWIFFDHMGPAQFSAGQGIHVRPHPHINLATVTYLFEGEILHRDSVGSFQAIRPGDLNLMVAGSGIVHSERERPEVRAKEHRLHGLQLWLALPEAQEQTDPAFYHYPSAEIPALTVHGVPVRVLMGSAYGLSSPVKTFAQTLYVEAFLQAGQTLALPLAQERAVYLVSGILKVGDTTIEEHAMAVMSAKPDVLLEAIADARIVIIGGQSMTPRFIEWNFVSSRKDRIEKAKLDWQQRRFPAIPGDDVEFIPLPE
jgi:redox-sensitive bicupin YhaK (pirin superfamily)